MERQCKASLNLLCHSMGNYVLKYASKPGNSSLRKLVFDNIGLVAADANNPGHEHSYFKGKSVKNNARLKRIFSRIFQGGNAEQSLTYHADINVYRT